MKHYYRVGEAKFANAILAWQEINSLRQTGKLTTFELVLDNGRLSQYDWTLPPPKGIRELEEDQARKLRADHKYLRLLYSGGSDSFSVADAFLRARQPIDEFVVYEWKTMGAACIDATFNTKMKVQWLIELHEKYAMPVTKISIVTVDQQVHDSFFQKNWFLEHAGHAGTESFNVNHVADMADLCPLPPGVTDYMDILGMEKPRVFADDNQVWFQMNDKNTLYGARIDRPAHWFYLSADHPELIAAQCRGTIQMANSLFPNMPLGQALKVLQNNKNFYHEWCLSVGRQTSRFQNSFVLMAKNVGQSLKNNGRYIHVDQYADVRASQWKQYEEYLNTVKELNNGDIVPGINTQRFVLDSICSK